MTPVMTPALTIIEAASAGDMDDVRGLLRAYAASLSVDLCFQGFDAELAGLPGAYGPPAGALLLCRDEVGRALGCVALRATDAHGVCEMKRLYLSPEARGRGVGRALVEAILRVAGERGYEAMRLDTLPEMADAIALYQRFGFEPIAPYYDTPVAGTRFLQRAIAQPAVGGD
jgi:ribosomal protein S18 acetylase RimI-like enzyme